MLQTSKLYDVLFGSKAKAQFFPRYKFKNIRYGAPPIGNLRWAKPQTPTYNSTLQDGSYGPYCVQGAPKGLNLLGPGDESPVGAAADQFIGGLLVPLFEGGNEDCLFLDVYVPGKAIRNTSLALPVISWIYGGAYLFGAKDSYESILPFYDGTGLVHQSDNDLIFVTMNYRVGAYGWLAGSTMEKDGLPNAGLWDQRAAMQWIQDYISLLGGDSTQVTAMGESAGAGSILHHLVGEGGTLDPLFSKAILQSPAYEYLWDRKGKLEDTFIEFAGYAGCNITPTVDCLRAASEADLVAANNALNLAVTDGAFAVGPSADGGLVRQLAPLELASGNFYRTESLIISHVADEPTLFVDGHIQTDAEFDDFIDSIFPTYTQTAGITDIIEAFYPPVSTNKTYATETDRYSAFLRDSSFTCNTRHLTEAFGDANIWNLQYSVTPGYHATDLLPTFYKPTLSLDSLLEDIAFTLVPLFVGIAEAYQSYITSYAITGDPNTRRATLNVPPAIAWNHPDSSGEKITGVLNVDDIGFDTVADAQNERTPCDFWREVAAAITNVGGYAPPGAVVPQSLVPVEGDPSVNYAT